MVQQSIEVQIFVGLFMLALTGLAMACAAASEDHEEAVQRQRRWARRRARHASPQTAIHFRHVAVRDAPLAASPTSSRASP